MSKSQPLSLTHPDLSLQAHGWDPSTLSFGSHAKKEWRCELGHIWIASVAHRARGTGCPICNGNAVLVGFNDLATTAPEIAKQAYGWDPKLVTRNSNKKVLWECSLGHIWDVAPNQRSAGYGCPFCSGKKVLAGFNDLMSTDPEIAEQAHGWDPTTVSRGSDAKKDWKCEYDHVFNSSVSARTSGRGCHFCSGHKVLAGFNDLETTDPEIASKAHGWDAKTVSRSSASKREWICGEGHTWVAVVHSLTRGSGCPICSGKKLLIGFNDLATTDPEIAKQAFGWDASTVTRSSNMRLSWKCSVGHEWKTSPGHRTDGTGCPSCATSGFDYNSPSWLYFIRHDEWKMLQIGITNFPEQRLFRHKKNGWELIELRGPMDGMVAHEWEAAILRMLNAKGADLSNATIAGKFDGYSEAWSESAFEIKSIQELMQLTEEFEEN